MSDETQELTARIKAHAKWLHDAYEKTLASRDPDWGDPKSWDQVSPEERDTWFTVANCDILDHGLGAAEIPRDAATEIPEGAVICPHCRKVLEIEAKAFKQETLVPPASFAVQITCCKSCRCALTVLVQPMG